MRQYAAGRHDLQAGKFAAGHLLQLPSVLYRQAKTRGHFGAGGTVSPPLRRLIFGGVARAFGEPPSASARPPAPLAGRKALLFALMTALWIAAGLFGRDPWKPQETEFAVLVAAQNGALPDLPDAARPRTPPTWYLDVAAASARLFSPPLSSHEGARIINALLLAGGFAFIGLAAGGGARGGWMAVLLTLGMTGFVVRAHLLNVAAAAFFGAAMLLWGALRLRRHALAGGGFVGGAAVFLFAAASPSAALFAAGGVFAALSRAEWRRPSVVAGLTAAAVFFVPLALLSPAAETAAAAFAPKNDWTVAADLARLSAWVLFPTLPLAAAALWRRRNTDATMFLCMTMTAAAAAHFLLFGGREEDLFWMMPPLAVFAARGLESLPDDCAVILDWFAVIVAGACCVGGMWAAWFLWQSGVGAEWAAEWFDRFPLLRTPQISAWTAVPAALITISWIGLAANFGRSNERAILNWSCGVTVAWCVFNLLWTPVLDSGKSYRRTAAAVLAASGGECVSASSSAGATAAQLYYFGVAAGDDSCRWRLQRDSETAPAGFAREWTGGRYGAQNYVLYRKII